MSIGRWLVPVLVLLLLGCRKENAHPGGAAMSDWILLSVDSACVQAANTITPNGDGVNDRFIVLGNNITDVAIRIHNAQGAQVFSAEALTATWDGTDGQGTGPYTVDVEAVTTSHVFLRGRCLLYVLDYGGDTCLHHPSTPVCGDQLDPRICGISYPTNEVFCP